MLKQQPKEQPKKYARSKLEIQAYWQRNIQITLTLLSVVMTGLTMLKVFGVL